MTWPRLIRSKIGLLESATFQLQDRMLSSFFAQSLTSYGNFSDLGVEIAFSHRYAGFFLFFGGKMNTAIHGFEEGITKEPT